MSAHSSGSGDEIVKLRRLWPGPELGGEQWLVTFDLIRIEGRLECVGVSLRSYLTHLGFDGNARPSEVLLTDPLNVDLGKEVDEWIPSGPRSFYNYWFERLVSGQAHALEEFAKGTLLPRPLTTETLRKFNFSSEARRARQGEAKLLRQEAELTAVVPLWPWGSPAELSEFAADFERVRRGAGKRKRGRPPKYTLADLVQVAQIYNAARDHGSLSPTKDVSDATGWTPDVADKLVRRCRDLKPPLISPARSGKPVAPSVANDEPEGGGR